MGCFLKNFYFAIICFFRLKIIWPTLIFCYFNQLFLARFTNKINYVFSYHSNKGPLQ